MNRTASMKPGRRIFFLAAMLLLLAPAAFAATEAPAEKPAPAIDLGAPFCDNAILQRQMPVPVWGWSKPGTKVTVSFKGQAKTASADKNGKWMVRLDPLTASADPAEMTVTDSAGHKVTLKNILVGEVWLASGQSNMEWIASKCNVGRVLQKQIAERVAAGKETEPVIREVQITNVWASIKPVTHAEAEWSTQTGDFSAIAYAFAYFLYRDLKVPIGILNCSFSSTSIEAWTPEQGFAGGTDAYTKGVYQRILETDPTTPEHKKAWAAYYKQIEDTLKINDKRIAEGKDPVAMPKETPGNLRGNRDATWLFNARLNPMVPYAIRGAIWNQGYANSGGGYTYYYNLHSLIRGWRKVWDRPELPVYFHQFYSAGYNDGLSLSSVADMRLGTSMARDIPNADMASQIDITGGIHYTNKTVPGQRLALLALKNQYGKDIVADGPIFKSYEVKGNKLIVTFDYADGGLVVGETGTQANPKTGPGLANPTVIPNGADKVTIFYLADKNRVWHRAKLKIDGEKVVLTAPGVAKPCGVAYGCDGVGSMPNLYNRALLPMTPFIYYDHKLVTADTWPDDPIKVAGVTPDPDAGGLRYEYRKMPLLSAQFRDNAVLQAGAAVTIWGSAVHDWGYEAKGKAEIKFSFNGIEKTIPVTHGMREWHVTVPPMAASAEPKTLKVVFTIDGEIACESECKNVVVGDVWYVSTPIDQGQGKAADGPVRVMTRRAKRDKFRNPSRFSVCVSTTPGNRFASEWMNADSGFAAQLGKAIHAKTDKPVGIILMDGAELELKHWICFQCLKNAPSLMADYKDLAALHPGNEYYNANVHRYLDAWKKFWSVSVPQLMATGRPIDGARWGSYPTLGGKVTSDASQAFNVMVTCFGPASLKGIIFIASPTMCQADQGANYAQQLADLGNCWKGWFAHGPGMVASDADPYFFYTQPSKTLAPKIAQPEGIKGQSKACTIDHWLKAQAKGRKLTAEDQKQTSKELKDLVDTVINSVYK